MGNRLTKIVTRTGDDGSTGLANGTRLDKSSARINALGDVDELNSHIGVLIADTVNAEDRAFLQAVQQDLFDLGSELAVPGNSYLRTDACADLENYVAAQTTYLPPLREFILPHGGAACRACAGGGATRGWQSVGCVAAVSQPPVRCVFRAGSAHQSAYGRG